MAMASTRTGPIPALCSLRARVSRCLPLELFLAPATCPPIKPAVKNIHVSLSCSLVSGPEKHEAMEYGGVSFLWWRSFLSVDRSWQLLTAVAWKPIFHLRHSGRERRAAVASSPPAGRAGRGGRPWSCQVSVTASLSLACLGFGLLRGFLRGRVSAVCTDVLLVTSVLRHEI
jgi:hypothetical protein